MDTSLYKLLTKDKQARIYLIDNTALVEQLKDELFKSAVASDAFYSAMTFCIILHGIMTNAKRISIKLETSDPSAFLICGADDDGNIQGYATDEFRQKVYADLKSIIGTGGCLKIIQDNGLGTVFTGIVETKYDKMTDNLAHYFSQSEQTQTVFRYFRNIQDSMLCFSRGVLIQALPFADNSLISDWDNRITMNTEMFSDAGASMENIIKKVFSDADIVDEFPVRLKCSCSKEMILYMLLGLGNDELNWTLNDNQNIEVQCNKCGERYTFGADEIQRLLMNEND